MIFNHDCRRVANYYFDDFGDLFDEYDDIFHYFDDKFDEYDDKFDEYDDEFEGFTFSNSVVTKDDVNRIIEGNRQTVTISADEEINIDDI